MPRTLTETEAQTHFSQIITDACNGEEIIIARGSTPVIRLMPIPQTSGFARQQAQDKQEQDWAMKIAAIRQLRKKAVIGPPIGIEEIISARDEGRR